MARTALVIDDNRSNADILCNFLSLLDIQASAAYGPRPALAKLHETMPDVIFLDLSMPGWSGFEVLAYLRRDPHTADIPVIVVTGDDQNETKLKALEEGAKAVLVKPVNIESLEEILRNLDLLGG